MSRGSAGLTAALLLGPLALLCGSLPQQGRATDAERRPAAPEVIFTAAPVYESLAALHGDERFPAGAQLMALRAGRVEALTPGFAASADANLSPDAKNLLFAGKKRAGEPWQIWQMPVAGGEPRLVLAGTTDLIRPLELPDGQMVFARREPGGFVLEAAGLDGSPARQLSYGPGSYVPDDVLRDGRVLFESGYPLGAGTTPELYLVYADGGGVESVRCDHGAAREHGREMASGDVVFTTGRGLARFTSAYAEQRPVAAPAGEYAGDVVEFPGGYWLLSVRRRGEKHYALTLWRPGSPAERSLAADGKRDLVEPVVVAPRAVPNRHPSALHNWTTGNLLALDARESRDGELQGTPAAVRVESLVAGQAVVTGTAPVAPDGSFFVQAKGDRPLRFILLDAQGKTLRAEQGWFWVRRGEQRICVGCHTGPERAPDNRVPEVLLRSTTPTDVTGGRAVASHGGS